MGLMKKLTSAIVASSLVLSLVATASAAYTPAAGETAGTRMQKLGIIQGRPEGLALNSEITRAELVTVIVRAFGKEEDAKLLKGSTIFPDIQNHWASGNIAMAVALAEKAGSDPIGMPDGKFAPDAKLTPAQAVAFLMKFVGAKADAAKTWPANYLDVAVEKNLITAEDKALIAPMLNDNATRGLVFYLFDRAFITYQLPAGKTFYTTYVDTKAPELTVNAVEATTIDTKVTVTGNVKDFAELYVGTTKVTPDATGNFSSEVALPELKAYDITVTALDVAGNKAEKSFSVTRAAGTPAAIQANDITVAAGATVEVGAKVVDAKGNAVVATVTGDSAVGTYADGKFTAQAAIGTGKLTLKVGELTKDVNVTIVAGALAKVEASAVSVAPGKQVTLVAKDAAGNTITGATFSQSSADALLDATTGVFMASKAGTYTVKATKDGVTVEGTVGVYGDVDKLVVKAPATMVGNNETEYTVTVTAVDSKGNVVLGFDSNVQISGTGFAAVDDEDIVAAEDGVATFTVTADADYANSDIEIIAEYDTDEDTAGMQASDEYSGFATVEAQVATTLEVEADGEYMATNDRTTPVEITVNVLDQKGEEMVEGAWEVAVAVTGPASLESDDDTKTDDISISSGSTFNIYPNEAGEAGDVVVTVSFPGMTAGKDTLKARFAQEPKAIQISTEDNEKVVDEETAVAPDTVTAVTYDIQVVDKNGVPADFDGTLDLTFEGISSGDKAYVYVDNGTGFHQLSVATDAQKQVTVADGKASFKVNAQKAITFTVKAEDNESVTAYTLTDSAAASMTFTPADAAYVGLTKELINYLRKDVAEVTVTAQLYDRFGNKVAKSGVELNFDADSYDGVEIDGSDDTDGVDVDTDANGAASVKVTLANYVATVDVTVAGPTDIDAPPATFDIGGSAYETITLTAMNVVPTTLSLEIVSDDTVTASRPSSVAAGGSFYLKATVKDNYGRIMENADLAGFTWDIKDNSTKSGWDAGSDTMTDNGDGYFFSGAITPLKAETLGMTLELNGGAQTLTVTKSIAVKAGDVAGVILVEANDDDELDITANKVSEFTVQLTDANGNVVSGTQVTETYTVSLTSTDTGANFRNANGQNIHYVNIASGKTTAKVTYIGGDLTDTVSLALGTDFTDANSDGDVDGTEWTAIGGAAATPSYTLK